LTKEGLRRLLRQRRAHFVSTCTADELDCLSLQQAALFERTFPLEDSCVIAGYWPLSNECDPTPLLQCLARSHKNVVLPRIERNHLIFVPWAPSARLEPGPLGTSQPTAKAPILMPDYIITPLVAFDKKGARLGQGGGFYDRTFHRFAKQTYAFTVVGYAFDCQYVDFIPQDTQDYPLDYVITPTTLYDFRNGQ
jgi:5-formyltetrahydrofolate cyclo-ligase